MGVTAADRREGGMPPHCDSIDGPVVQAAMRALAANDVDLVLPYVKASGEKEVRQAFERVVAAREQGEGARDVADRYLFDTVVRVHRAGEGAPFTGVKPAGLPVGPVIPIAEAAIASGSADELTGVLQDAILVEVRERFERVLELQVHADGPVPEARDYVEAMLGLEVWANDVYRAIVAEPHAGGHGHA